MARTTPSKSSRRNVGADGPVVPIYRKQEIGSVQIGGRMPLAAAVLHTIADYVEHTGESEADAFEFDAYGSRVQVRIGDAIIPDDELPNATEEGSA